LGVVLALTAGLATLRVGWVVVPGALTVLPILASMFMFRLIIYLYDLPHERKPVPLLTRLAYFFMLPNLVFPLFPVVDYQRFTSAHYAGEADAIHRKGVGWVLLGALQVLAYRAIHATLVPDPAAIANVEDVVLSGVTAYLQYLRIAAMFHIAVGILCLFGFNMPATNRWYFLSSSYTEFWRRINIYWKDFLQKIVYFPVYMRLRKRHPTRALVLATFSVFVSSWFLHAWQWFWLQGEVLFTDVDIAFWALVGAAVVLSALQDQQKPGAVPPRSPLHQAVVRTAKTALLFSATAGLWSLWSSPSLAEWGLLVGQARHGSVAMVARMVGVAAALLLLGVGLSWLEVRGQLPDLDAILRRGPTLVGAGGALVLFGVAAPQLPDRSPWLALAMEPQEGPVGYYEGLLEGDAAPERRALVPQGAADADDAHFADGPVYRQTNGLRRYEMYPSTDYLLKGAAFRTNEHGMRDGPVSRTPTPGVVRIALLGASPELGTGVASGDEYPALLEQRLGPGVEVLNFAVVGYSPVQQVGVLDDALAFEPDLVLLMSHGMADRALTLKLLFLMSDPRRPFPPELQSFAPARWGGVGQRRAWTLSQVEPVTHWAYERIAARSREAGAVPLWVHLPLPGDPPRADAPRTVEAWAQGAGLETLLLEDMYRGHDRFDLTLGAGDRHPNTEAHGIIAERLARELRPWVERLGD
jgi:hypothetical protein